MLITIETNHTVEIHNRTHHSRHNHRTRVNEIEEFSECSSDCTDLSEIAKNKSILKHLTIQKTSFSLSNSSNLPVTLRGPEHC